MVHRRFYVCVLSLEKIFEKAGQPQVILKDKGSDIKKGVAFWNQKQETPDVLTIDDIEQTPLIVSSDVIESFFGKFKVMIQRNPMAELNRLIYTIPLLCGNTTIAGLDLALNEVSHTELQKTLKDEIPETLRSSRQQFFNSPSKGVVPKNGKLEGHKIS